MFFQPKNVRGHKIAGGPRAGSCPGLYWRVMGQYLNWLECQIRTQFEEV